MLTTWDEPSATSRSCCLHARLVAGLAGLMLIACGAPAGVVADDLSSRGSPVQELPSAVACVVAPSTAGSAALEDDVVESLDAALARASLDRDALGLPSERTATSGLAFDDPRMLEAARASLRHPLELRGRGRDAARVLDEALASERPVSRAVLAAAALREAPAALCADPSWLEPLPGDAPLAAAIVDATGMAADALPELRGVPLELQQALVPIVRALAWATTEIEAARSSAGDAAPRLLPAIDAVPGWILGIRRFDLSASLVDAFERVDTRRIATAAASVAAVVEGRDLRRFAGVELTPVVLSTPIGAIVLRGTSSDAWDATDAPMLLVDTGGDDAYFGPVAAASLARPISVAVDLGGHDVYAYREIATAADAVGTRLPSDGAGRAADGRTLSVVGRQGSGVLGVGLLFDLGEDPDRYRSLVASQGAGSHGVGVLFDDGGDDVYEAEGLSQGAAAWGIGLLLDRGGADRYVVHHAGQGFGFTRGIGALVDDAGDDLYTADPGEPSLGGSPLYVSDQLPGPPSSIVVGNHSFAQGCGAGHRPDWPDPGWPFPGGLGILRDASGDDRYAAGVFAQGCGFVQGVGMLLDGAGDDAYDGLYYVEGAAAHLAAAILADEGGDDRFNERFPVQGPTLAVGHDLSVALHVNRGGDDMYRASWSSLGSGIANGIGVFADVGGSDRFEARSTSSLGSATTSDVREGRRGLPTVGLFSKSLGAASYVIAGAAVDRRGETWTCPSADPTVEIGVGTDRPDPSSP